LHIECSNWRYGSGRGKKMPDAAIFVDNRKITDDTKNSTLTTYLIAWYEDTKNDMKKI